MRIASIRNFDITNGEGIGIALFVQGCSFHCKDCFNQSTWDFDCGVEWDDKYKEYFVSLSQQPHIERITILGGEPLHPNNRNSVISLIKEIKEKSPHKKIWVYTGYLYEDIKDEIDLSSIDIMVDGRFVTELKDYRLKWRGSSNQRVINIQESIKEDKVILWCD